MEMKIFIFKEMKSMMTILISNISSVHIQIIVERGKLYKKITNMYNM